MESDGIPAPSEGLLMTHFLTVREVARSRRFYSEVLGGQVVLDENPCIVKLANSWIIMNRGGGPTPDKPDVTPVPPGEPHTVSSFMNLRVADIEACYAQWSAKGAEFLTPPIDRRAEVRCYLRDPDRYLIEVGQATGHRNAGMLEYWNTGRYFRPHRHRHRFRVVLPPQAAPMTLPPARSRHAADSLIRAGHQTSGAVEGFPGCPEAWEVAVSEVDDCPAAGAGVVRGAAGPKAGGTGGSATRSCSACAAAPLRGQRPRCPRRSPPEVNDPVGPVPPPGGRRCR